MSLKDAWRQFLDGCWRDEEGQTLVEYVMVIPVVSTALIGTLILLKDGTDGFYQQIITAVEALT